VLPEEEVLTEEEELDVDDVGGIDDEDVWTPDEEVDAAVVAKLEVVDTVELEVL
jgi:hypothetical protein